MIRKRRASREGALQLLYAIDIDGDLDRMDSVMFGSYAADQMMWFQDDPDPTVRNLVFLLMQGVYNHVETIDSLIENASENWTVKRLSVIDRNILRIALFEIAFVPDVPPRVAINEAIEIAKIYGTENSPKFINGVLDRIYRILKMNRLDDNGRFGGKLIE